MKVEIAQFPDGFRLKEIQAVKKAFYFYPLRSMHAMSGQRYGAFSRFV